MNLNHFTQYSIINLVVEHNPFTVFSLRPYGLYSHCFSKIQWIFIVMNYEAKLMWKKTHYTYEIYMKYTFSFEPNHIHFGHRICRNKNLPQRCRCYCLPSHIITYSMRIKNVCIVSDFFCCLQFFLHICSVMCKIVKCIQHLSNWTLEIFG